MNVGLELAIVYAWARWHAACQDALRENFTLGEPSEDTMIRVELLEDQYNHLVETKRATQPPKGWPREVPIKYGP